MELMQTDLPLPVAPAMRTWGILARSATATPPVISLPRATVRGLAAFWKAGESRISRRYDSARKRPEKNPFIDSCTPECYI